MRSPDECVGLLLKILKLEIAAEEVSPEGDAQ